jgi:hypothetical protein
LTEDDFLPGYIESPWMVSLQILTEIEPADSRLNPVVPSPCRCIVSSRLIETLRMLSELDRSRESAGASVAVLPE